MLSSFWKEMLSHYKRCSKMHAEFIFERNVVSLQKMFHLLSCKFLGVFPRDRAYPFVSKYVLHIHTTYESGILDQGGEQGQPSEKWFITLKSFFTAYEKEDFTISLKHWRSKSKMFKTCISDGHASRNIGHNQRKIAKIYAFVHRNLMVYTENYMTLNLVANSVVFDS